VLEVSTTKRKGGGLRKSWGGGGRKPKMTINEKKAGAIHPALYFLVWAGLKGIGLPRAGEFALGFAFNKKKWQKRRGR